MDTAVAPSPRASLETAATSGSDGDARAAAIFVALLAFTVPLATGYSVWSTPTGADDWLRRISVAPFDIVLLVAVGWTALRPTLWRHLFRSRAVQVAAAAFVVCFAASLAATFGPLGVALAARLLAGLAVIIVVGAAMGEPESRRLALGALTAAGTAQAVLAMVQAARGEAFGIELLDFAGPLYPFGSSHAGRGGLTHPYHLAVFLVMAQGAALLGVRQARAEARTWAPWLAALAVMGAGIGVTYTRSGALGQIGLLVCLALARRDRARTWAAAGAILVGLAVGGAAFGDGWVARGEATAGTSATASADSNRGERFKEAKELIEAKPLLGVGPGRYVEALTATDRLEYLPAHDLLAHEAAELGIVGGVVVLALLALLGLRVLRGGAWTAAVVAPMIPFLLLDAYPYVFATGLAISALWLGLARASLDDPETVTP